MFKPLKMCLIWVNLIWCACVICFPKICMSFGFDCGPNSTERKSWSLRQFWPQNRQGINVETSDNSEILAPTMFVVEQYLFPTYIFFLLLKLALECICSKKLKFQRHDSRSLHLIPVSIVHAVIARARQRLVALLQNLNTYFSNFAKSEYFSNSAQRVLRLPVLSY